MNEEHVSTLKDKIYRSVAGQKIIFCLKKKHFMKFDYSSKLKC